MLVRTLIPVYLIIVLYSTNCLSQPKKNMTNGASSPIELINSSITATEKNNFAAFQQFYYIKSDKDKKEVEALIGLMKLEPRIKEFKDAGYKKFGDSFYEVLDKVHYELNLGLECMPDFKSVNTKEIKIQAMLEDTIASTTINQKDILGDSQRTGFIMIEEAGRWYYSIANGREVLYIAMNQLISEAEPMLAEAKTVEGLKEKINPLRNLFNDYYDL